MPAVCKRFCVAGRVQGVSFRAGTAAEARRLGLRGWAENLADGRVEVMACGKAADVDALERWLHVGPPMARVKSVQGTAETGDALLAGLDGFRVR